MHSGPTPPGQKSPIRIGNALHWKDVDRFTLLQAACLWAGIEPLNDFGDLRTSPKATAAYHVLTRAIEDGRLVAHHRSRAPRTIIVPAGGEHKPDMLVYREDLVEVAEQLGEEPLFLFVTSGKTRQAQSQKRFSRAKLEDWYYRRVAEWPSSDPPPSRDDDLKAAKVEFPGAPRDIVRELRRELAPPEWTRKGARPRK